MLMMSYMIVGNGHLSTTNTRTDVAHAVVVPYFLVLIIRIAFAILCGVHHDFSPFIFVSGDQCTTARGGNHLIAVETEHTIFTKRTQYLSVKLRAKTFCSILHHGNAILVGNLHNAVSFVGHTIQSHRHNCFWLLSRLSNSILNGLFEELWIHIPSILLGINEHWCCAKIGSRMRRCTECEALNTHFITRAYATI